MADGSSPSPEVINPRGAISARVANPGGYGRAPNLLGSEITGRAVAALRDGQRTFTNSQVAYLMALAFNSGAELGKILSAEDLAEDAASWVEFAQPRATRERRIAERHAEMEAAERARIRRAKGRPDIRGPLYGVVWPQVAIPGTVNPAELQDEWPCPCRRRTEWHGLDGYHRTPQAFPVPQRRSQYARAAA